MSKSQRKRRTRAHIIADLSGNHLEWRDMVYCLNEPLPVILVVYDAKSDRAWWLYLNETLREEGRSVPTGAKLTVRVPLTNVLDRAAIRRFRKFRDAALARSRA
jgi:hypothetical protein